MAERSPAFQFYPGDWLSSPRVSMMTLEEQGAYFRLLCYAWQDPDCCIPSDPAILLRLFKGELKSVPEIVLTMFVPSVIEGKIYNPRLLEERKKQVEFREAKVLAGKKSGKSRRLRRRSEAAERHTNKPRTEVEQKPNETRTNDERNRTLQSSVFSLQSSSSSSSPSSPSGEEPPTPPSGGAARRPKKPKPPIPVLEIVSLAESRGLEIPRTSEGALSPQLIENIERLWRKSPKHQCIEWWRDDLIGVALANDFLAGQTHHNFKLTLGWLCGPRNSKAVLGGEYAPSPRGARAPPGKPTVSSKVMDWLQQEEARDAQKGPKVVGGSDDRE